MSEGLRDPIKSKERGPRRRNVRGVEGETGGSVGVDEVPDRV